MSMPDAEAIMARIAPLCQQTEAGCLLWRGDYVDGQPDLLMRSRHIKVRRWLYQQAGGHITSGQVALPLCTRQACVAPEHVQVRGRGRRTWADQGASGYAGPVAAKRCS
jgi:hypothetical protein